MGSVRVNEDIKEASISAVVIRANEQREDLGVIAYYHRNPLKRAAFHLKEKLNGNRPR